MLNFIDAKDTAHFVANPEIYCAIIFYNFLLEWYKISIKHSY